MVTVLAPETPQVPDTAVHDPERVARVRTALPDGDTIESLATIFGLLADPGRLRLLSSLLESGELCVQDLAAATDSSDSGVSHALRLLRASRVVRVRRSGRHAFYRLADSHVRVLLDVALAHLAHDDTAGEGAS